MLILWVYWACPGHAGVKANDRADRLAGNKASTIGVLRLGRSEVLRSLRHFMRAQSQGHHTVDCLEERCVERGFIYLLKACPVNRTSVSLSGMLHKLNTIQNIMAAYATHTTNSNTPLLTAQKKKTKQGPHKRVRNPRLPSGDILSY